MRSLLVTVLLCSLVPVLAQDEPLLRNGSFEEVPDRAPPGQAVLTSRTARGEHEAKLEGDEEHFGAEHNPTGNPIGGGEGYDDILTSGDFTVRTSAELREALEQARAGQVVFIPGGGEIDMTDAGSWPSRRA